MNEIIRAEVPADHAVVHALNAAAFGRPAEARLVDALRAQARPIVSLVAQVNGEVVGHILFSPVTLSGYDALLMGLAPMAVAPGRQRGGIGSRLARTGLEECSRMGAQAAVVLGHPSSIRASDSLRRSALACAASTTCRRRRLWRSSFTRAGCGVSEARCVTTPRLRRRLERAGGKK